MLDEGLDEFKNLLDGPMILRLLCVVLLLVVLLPACNKRAKTNGSDPNADASRDRSDRLSSSKKGGDETFVWVAGGARYLDPNKVSETSGNDVAMNMFEGLLVYNVRTGPPLPGVATRYTVSKDGKTYTFTLRKNAKWSNGRGVTARDFEYSWKRALDPKFLSENAELIWQFVENAEAYKKGKLTDWRKVGVKVIDDHTLQLQLKNPTPFFPHLAAYIAYAPVPREAVEKFGNDWTKPEHIVVNGAYKMVYYKLRDKIILEKNPHYWDVKNVRIKRWEYHHSERESQAHKKYSLGLAHYTPGNVPTELVPSLKASGRKDFHIDPYLCVYYYVFNTKRKPFDNVNVRRAFNMAINKDELTTNLLRGGQISATNLVPHMFKKTLGYVSPKGDPFDPKKARQLLKDAGAIGKINLIFNAYEGHVQIGNFVSANLKKYLGVEVTTQKMEWKSLLAKLQKHDYQFARGSWCADYPDPLAFLQVFHSDGASNYSQYKNPEYDKLLAEIMATSDRKERNRLIVKAEKMLARDVPLLPIYHYTRQYMLSPKIGGLEPHFQDHHLVKYMYFKK